MQYGGVWTERTPEERQCRFGSVRSHGLWWLEYFTPRDCFKFLYILVLRVRHTQRYGNSPISFKYIPDTHASSSVASWWQCLYSLSFRMYLGKRWPILPSTSIWFLGEGPACTNRGRCNVTGTNVHDRFFVKCPIVQPHLVMKCGHVSSITFDVLHSILHVESRLYQKIKFKKTKPSLLSHVSLWTSPIQFLGRPGQQANFTGCKHELLHAGAHIVLHFAVSQRLQGVLKFKGLHTTF